MCQLAYDSPSSETESPASWEPAQSWQTGMVDHPVFASDEGCIVLRGWDFLKRLTEKNFLLGLTGCTPVFDI